MSYVRRLVERILNFAEFFRLAVVFGRILSENEGKWGAKLHEHHAKDDIVVTFLCYFC